MTIQGQATEPLLPDDDAGPIVFFDGVCGLCNGFVDHVLTADRARAMRFAPIQGVTARDLLPELPEQPERWSMVYLDERGVHVESDAPIEIWRRLGGWRGWLGLARWVPRCVRNPVYRFVARHRYRWFGRLDTCRAPAPEHRSRFLP